MRDYTQILEVEVIPLLSSQHATYHEIQGSVKKAFNLMSETQKALDSAEMACDRRWGSKIDEKSEKIKQLEEDIASMIHQMKEQDRRTKSFKNKMEQKLDEAEAREESLRV